MVLKHFPVDYTSVMNEPDRYHIELQRITVCVLTTNSDCQKHTPERIIFFIAGQPFFRNGWHILIGVSSTPPAAMFYLYPKFSAIGLVPETIFR
jgi:hypothetical protein